MTASLTRSSTALAAVLCLALGLSPAAAKPGKPRPAAQSAAVSPARTINDAERQRQEANAQQAKAAQDQVAANASAQQAYRDAVKAREEQIDRDKADYDAKIAAEKAAHDAAMKKWYDDVAACGKGDKTRCAKSK